MVKKYVIQDVATVGRIRSIASQFVACMCPFILLVDLGSAISISTLIVPDVLNADDGLSINDVQASWFGSVAFLVQPIGALFSGPLVDVFGRKKGNFLASLAHTFAWIITYFAYDVPTLFISNILLGLGTGLLEAPINSYVGEVTEPSVRGAMCSLTQTWAAIGIFLLYFLGTVVNWRIAALISLTLPIAAMLLILIAPETPVWLLSKGREDDALKSLCYLRGWTTPGNVKQEFDMLLKYSKNLRKCLICVNKKEKKADEKCEHDQLNFFKRAILKFRYTMFCKETLRPLLLITMYFVFLNMSGLYAIKPYMVNVSEAFGMAGNGLHTSLIVGVLLFVGTIIVASLIKILGKRRIAIIGMFGTFVFATSLSVYAKMNLSNAVFSYNTETFPKEKSVVPLVLFYMLALFTGISIPWVLFGEVFPFKSRALAQGVAAAGNYVITFIACKTFMNLEIAIHLWGTFAVYAVFGFIGTFYLYLYLPETEGKTLQEIEDYYNGERNIIFANDPIIKRLKGYKK